MSLKAWNISFETIMVTKKDPIEATKEETMPEVEIPPKACQLLRSQPCFIDLTKKDQRLAVNQNESFKKYDPSFHSSC